ncbi:hypothetical protein ACTHPH_24410 [Paenibacillus pasadenensis]|uniref:Uncharacterized protein n=1 Tax=Paenibacillus pasadenensis TaxID=217090 RepID=A0A2N5NBM0_9BACL|nr:MULTISPECIES: hypothetical protein [Paenibacillus]PLT47723.1 hypothetical protein B8V81_1947 [Paenibacillus pasadenensis]QGG57925.1 hypothetical protein GE073_21705 [Paenibacillus sp. B01]
MPTILLQLSYLVLLVWAVYSFVQDLKMSRKDWLVLLLHLAVAIISLNWLLDSLGYKL